MVQSVGNYNTGSIDYRKWIDENAGGITPVDSSPITDTKQVENDDEAVAIDEFNNSSGTQQEGEKLEPNKGFFNKLKHLFTGKDYYKTSSGVNIAVDHNTGSVVETADGGVIIDGAKNAKIKGSKNDDNIVITNSSVKYVKGKGGNDSIYIENSDVKKVKGGRGDDTITINNSYVKKILGNSGQDEIRAKDSNIKKINGGFGKDIIITDGGFVKKVKDSSRDDIEIHDNPLNENPDEDFGFDD